MRLGVNYGRNNGAKWFKLAVRSPDQSRGLRYGLTRVDSGLGRVLGIGLFTDWVNVCCGGGGYGGIYE